MIKIRDLTVSFEKGAPVVDSLNLDVTDGKTTVVIGESGSGKSVTIAAILRILPKGATVTGSITLKGSELLAMTEGEINRLRGKTLGYVPQGGGNSMHPLMTTGAQIAEPIIFHKKETRKNALKAASDWLERVGLKPGEKAAQSYPHTLSGGMRQRALIAMGAAGGAEVLLADEPTKGLDSKRVAQIEELFNELHGTTILCVTHDLRFAERIADYVCVMYGGQAVEVSEAKAFFNTPNHPYSKMLISALPENGMNCPETFTPPIEQRSGCIFMQRCPQKSEICEREINMSETGYHQVRCVQYDASN